MIKNQQRQLYQDEMKKEKKTSSRQSIGVRRNMSMCLLNFYDDKKKRQTTKKSLGFFSQLNSLME